MQHAICEGLCFHPANSNSLKTHSCFFSVKVIWLLCLDCPPIAIAALLLKEWKYSVGEYFVCLFFFLAFYCFVSILDRFKTWNNKQTKITHRCKVQTLELSACKVKVSFKNCEWKSETRLASVRSLNKSSNNDYVLGFVGRSLAYIKNIKWHKEESRMGKVKGSIYDVL